MRNTRGLETLGTAYLLVSVLAAVVFVMAGFVLRDHPRWWYFGAAAGVLFQGFLYRAVLGWMSDLVLELSGIRDELQRMRSSAPRIPADRKQVVAAVAAAASVSGPPRIVEVWGVRQCSVCLRNLPATDLEACPHCGARFEKESERAPDGVQ